MEILTVKLACVYGWYLEEKAEKLCEIPTHFSLEDLCDFILESFAFDNDHLHEFFISRRSAGSEKFIIKDETITLVSLLPREKNHHLFMHFDFGDDWVFKRLCRKILMRLQKIKVALSLDATRLPMRKTAHKQERSQH